MPSPHSLSDMLGQFDEDRRHFQEIVTLVRGFRTEMDRMSRQFDGIVQQLTGQHTTMMADLNAWREGRNGEWQSRIAMIDDLQQASGTLRERIAGNEGQVAGLQAAQRDMQQTMAELEAACTRTARTALAAADDLDGQIQTLQTSVKRLQWLSLLGLAVAIVGVFR